MLQQTQASRVTERFERFMRRFPTPAALASSPEGAILEEWQGLGYYRRAVLLRRAAIAIVEDFDGRVPERAEALERLPGIGRYTAGAVASIVHGERSAIVDGNVARVLLRVGGVARPLRDPEALRRCWREAQSLVDACGDPGALNEGLMELGATVCTPANPRCGACPLRAHCRARLEGRQARIPAPPPARRRPTVVMDACIVALGGRLLLERRSPRGMWAGLWQPPTFESTSARSTAQIRAALRDRLAGPGSHRGWRLESAGEFVHRATHREFRVRVHRVTAPAAVAPSGSGGSGAERAWVERRRLAQFPHSNLVRRVLETAERGLRPPRGAGRATAASPVGADRATRLAGGRGRRDRRRRPPEPPPPSTGRGSARGRSSRGSSRSTPRRA